MYLLNYWLCCSALGFVSILYAITQIVTEISDPVVVASPIGKSVVGKSFDARYTPGTRAHTIAIRLCRNDNSDLPQAQKYPLKLK